ncbi:MULTISPECIES: hypothetical protein [Streptomyces]|uniref:Uncharacterized protein n=1 Tax=Streptomyces tsukubensis (strain DSM 42081 / NBRC 108919 / NRRL 18488 / 9993) TaxID=1114943 RepID=I2N2E1_STRT9|nr:MULTISPECIES: hypothetical protein [Streptomyces]AZK95297.1 hypothetical protein B7R87_16625 [Streptomyces tsukubensis]EIF91188.1 hypothetical protein [Streptomyces tsukubensis NRRL18488]MYS62957.1 hypothetical protein [Streptomyces sp. SID5473]QKM68648.1 hypothetical protein STSU_017170 [Streptomyces tsukubensis NRRL18488]TAI43455.1 hypothetical protein EWI31_16925 [Streptomyces tsukubensis]
MRRERFHAFALEALGKGPDVRGAEPWDRGDHTVGLHVTFSTGAQVWISITTALAPGEKHESAEAPVHAEPPAEVPVPELYQDGSTTPEKVKHYLAAVMANSGCDEIALVYPYADDGHPGFGLQFHNGAKVFCLLVHSARPGQSPGAKYELQAAF